MAVGDAGNNLKFIEEIGVLLLEEVRGEDEGTLDQYVGQPCECPPAHEQTVGLG